MQKFSFLEAQKHSGQTEEVEIFNDGYKVVVRPIAPAQIDHILPIIKRLFRQAKTLWANKKGKDLDYLDLFVDVAFCSESREDTYKLIYSVLDRPDAKVYRNVNDSIEEFALFDYDDMVKNAQLVNLIMVAKVIWKQNAQKIFTSLAETAKDEEKKTPQQKEEQKKTPVKEEEKKPLSA